VGRQQASRSETVSAFGGLKVWERAGVRAPHKPLLVLYALGRWATGEHAIQFADAAEPLKALLAEFGPSRRSYHPEYPFWYLRNDRIWEVSASEPLGFRAGKAQPTAGELVRKDAVGSFTQKIQAALTSDPRLVIQIARDLLDAHFPTSIHEDILAAVGLNQCFGEKSRRSRDPRFREAVLTAYGYQCAVCGLAVRLGPLSVALDAAHIHWHAAGGPDEVSNGLCLCVLHHKLFDLGAFTVEVGSGMRLAFPSSPPAQAANDPRRLELIGKKQTVQSLIRARRRSSQDGRGKTTTSTISTELARPLSANSTHNSPSSAVHKVGGGRP
jgi:putative restriction endonuclease